MPSRINGSPGSIQVPLQTEGADHIATDNRAQEVHAAGVEQLKGGGDTFEPTVGFAKAEQAPWWDYMQKNPDMMNTISEAYGSLPNLKFWRTGEAPPRIHTRQASDFVDMALSQESKTYALGTEASKSLEHTEASDCSELVEWAAGRVGVQITDGSMNQKRATKRISVDEALHTEGALLFKGNPTQVAISVGDGVHTIEARWPHGVTKSTTSVGGFTHGGLIRGMKYD